MVINRTGWASHNQEAVNDDSFTAWTDPQNLSPANTLDILFRFGQFNLYSGFSVRKHI